MKLIVECKYDRNALDYINADGSPMTGPERDRCDREDWGEILEGAKDIKVRIEEN